MRWNSSKIILWMISLGIWLLALHWRMPNPGEKLAGVGFSRTSKNGRILDLPELKSGTTLI